MYDVYSLMDITSSNIVQRRLIPHILLSWTWRRSVQIIAGSVVKPQQHLWIERQMDAQIHCDGRGNSAYIFTETAPTERQKVLWYFG